MGAFEAGLRQDRRGPGVPGRSAAGSRGAAGSPAQPPELYRADAVLSDCLKRQREGLLQMVELRIAEDEDFGGRLTDMRLWLDGHRYEPSTFTYFYLDPGMMLRVSFSVDEEAEAFARQFGGSLSAATTLPIASEWPLKGAPCG